MNINHDLLRYLKVKFPLYLIKNHEMKMWWSISIAALILNLSTRWRCVASLRPGCFTLEKSAPQLAVWVPQPVCMVWKRRNSFVPAGYWTPVPRPFGPYIVIITAARKSKHFSLFLGYSDPTMEAAIPSETSVPIYHSTRRHYLEDMNLQEHRCENLKSLSFLRSCFPNAYRPTNVGVAEHPSGTFLECLHVMYMSCCFVNMASSGIHTRKSSRPMGWPRRPWSQNNNVTPRSRSV
jgi:hypothetical protein